MDSTGLEQVRQKTPQKQKLDLGNALKKLEHDVASSVANNTPITDEDESHGANQKQIPSAELNKILRPPLSLPVRPHNLPEQQEQQNQHSNSQNVTSIKNIDMQSLNPNMPIVDDHSASTNTMQTEKSQLDRSALFESICKFNRDSLRKIRTKD